MLDSHFNAALTQVTGGPGHAGLTSQSLTMLDSWRLKRGSLESSIARLRKEGPEWPDSPAIWGSPAMPDPHLDGSSSA